MDEFDVDGNPDPTKWVLCQKAGSDWNDEMSESYDQAYVKDGRLILKAEKLATNTKPEVSRHKASLTSPSDGWK